MTITWQTIITFAAVITAIMTVFKQYNRGYDMVKHQGEQDRAIEDLRKLHTEDANSIREQQQEYRKTINSELQLLTYGILACLKGLQEQGCDGDVTAAISKFEKHLNEKAHM